MSSRRHSRWLDRVLPPAVILVVLLIVWQGTVRLLDLPPWLLPAPSDIAVRFARTSNLGYHTGITVMEALAGFAISAVLGVGLSGVHRSLAVFRARPAALHHRLERDPNYRDHAAAHHLVRLRHRPKDHDMRDHLVLPDRHEHDPWPSLGRRRIIELMRSINATPLQVFLKVQLPSALPFIFAGFKIAASLALVGAVVAEFYSSDRGLGYLIITSATELRTDLLFVAIVILAVLGVISFALFGQLERWATRGQDAKAIL